MNVAHARQQLSRHASTLRAAARLEDWDEVSRVHQQFQGELFEWFAADRPAGDEDQVVNLLRELETLAEELADQVSDARDRCTAQLDPLRHNRRALRQYAAMSRPDDLP